MGLCVVSGWFYPVSYGVAAFMCYPYICVSEQVRDLVYLWGNVCEGAHFMFFLYCGEVCFVLCSVWCLSLCIIVGGKSFCWAICRIVSHSL